MPTRKVQLPEGHYQQVRRRLMEISAVTSQLLVELEQVAKVVDPGKAASEGGSDALAATADPIDDAGDAEGARGL